MAARSGMADIISQVRQLASAGTADYAVAGSTYWSDDQLQTILDRVRLEVWEETVPYVPTLNSGGTTVYTDYRIPWTWLESTTGGTAIFYLSDSTGARIGTANYTVDYQYGRVTFGADQHGSARYVTARSYDVYEAAARVWEQKAGHVAEKFDFTADGASFKIGEQRKAYLDMARHMRSQSNSGGMKVSRLNRDDVNNEPDMYGAVKATKITF
jgi:hypothetical protein